MQDADRQDDDGDIVAFVEVLVPLLCIIHCLIHSTETTSCVIRPRGDKLIWCCDAGGSPEFYDVVALGRGADLSILFRSGAGGGRRCRRGSFLQTFLLAL